MSHLYADTSALVGAYMRDEPDHSFLKNLLRARTHAVSTIEFSRIEFVGAMRAAQRARRLRRPDQFLETFELECSNDTIALLRPNPDRLIAESMRLMGTHALRTLDALHLATAILGSAGGPDEDFAFVTRDRAQAKAARAEGLEVL